MELHYEEECLSEGKHLDCFFVFVEYNGDPLKFDGCDYSSGIEMCKYADFMRYMDSILYTSDIDSMCMETFPLGKKKKDGDVIDEEKRKKKKKDGDKKKKGGNDLVNFLSWSWQID